MPYFVNVPNEFKISADPAEQSLPLLLFPLMTVLTTSWGNPADMRFALVDSFPSFSYLHSECTEF